MSNAMWCPRKAYNLFVLRYPNNYEQMLEDINNILNSGDVPSRYKVEDIEEINDVGKSEWLRKNLSLSKMKMFSAYLSRVKSNIHCVIAMSPLEEVFRTRLRRFPSLVNYCTIDWFTNWPEEVLLDVARVLFRITI